MSEQFLAQVSADLAPAIAAIEQASVRIASDRANRIAEVSGGAVQTTPEQLAAMQVGASDELFAALREQLDDVSRVFTLNISE